MTASDIEAGRGQKFEIINPEGDIEEEPMYVVSAKSVEVVDYEKSVKAIGYMGDINGTREPEGSEVQYDAVVWYVFKDIDGNYSDVLMLSKR